MKTTLDDIITNYIRKKLKNFNIYSNQDIIWVFYEEEWVFNLTEGQLISYSLNFFNELKLIFDIDDEKLNNIVYHYSMKLLRFNGPIEIMGENYPWTATLEGLNRRIEKGLTTITPIDNYGTKTN